MNKTIVATAANFESASCRTPEYLAWHRLFKREFKAFVTSHGGHDVDVSRPNHFDATGFFRIGGQAWYFSVGDLRGFKENMLIRTAVDYRDYTGGPNQYARLDSVDHFTEDFRRICRQG